MYLYCNFAHKEDTVQANNHCSLLQKVSNISFRIRSNTSGKLTCVIEGVSEMAVCKIIMETAIIILTKDKSTAACERRWARPYCLGLNK